MHLSSVAKSLRIDIPYSAMSSGPQGLPSFYASILVRNSLSLFLSPLYLVIKMISEATNYRPRRKKR